MAAKLYVDGFITVDFDHHEVRVKGHRVEIGSQFQWPILCLMVHHAGRAVSIAAFLAVMYDEPGAWERDYVKYHISQLQKRVQEASGQKLPIANVRGFGYRYEPKATMNFCVHCGQEIKE